MSPELKKLNWELKNSDPEDRSIYEKIYDEFKRLELEIYTDYYKGIGIKDKAKEHALMVMMLSNWPPFWIKEYSIYDKIKEMEDEGAFS